MKKIALVVTQSSWGGAQRYVYDLALSFKRQGHAVLVIAGNNKDPILQKRLGEQQIETIALASLIRSINPFIDTICFIQLFLLFRSRKFDVVHLNSSKAGVVGSVAAWFARSPCIVYTAHGFVFNEQLPPIVKRFYIFVERFSSFFRGLIITVSEFDHRTALQYGIAPKQKLRTIWNGIDVTHDTYVERQKARAYLLGDTGVNLNDKFVIGCVANFYANKGLSYLITAMKSVVEKYPHAVLLIVGDGSLRPDLEKLIINSGLSQHVFLIGYRKDPEQHLKAFDLLVSSSLKEGLSYTILEAARARVPIIATIVGGTPEIIYDHIHGILVPPRNTESLSEAIGVAIKDPQTLKTYAIQAHERVTKEFDVEKMVSATLMGYDEYKK